MTSLLSFTGKLCLLIVTPFTAHSMELGRGALSMAQVKSMKSPVGFMLTDNLGLSGLLQTHSVNDDDYYYDNAQLKLYYHPVLLTFVFLFIITEILTKLTKY